MLFLFRICLVFHKRSVTLKDRWGNTALNDAEKAQSTDVVKLIQRHNKAKAHQATKEAAASN